MSRKSTHYSAIFSNRLTLVVVASADTSRGAQLSRPSVRPSVRPSIERFDARARAWRSCPCSLTSWCVSGARRRRRRRRSIRSSYLHNFGGPTDPTIRRHEGGGKTGTERPDRQTSAADFLLLEMPSWADSDVGCRVLSSLLM